MAKFSKQKNVKNVFYEPPVGFEPTTYCLQDSRSGQLS